MATDQNTAKWEAEITVTLKPKNTYGDSTGDGEFTFIRVVKKERLSEIVEMLEEIK